MCLPVAHSPVIASTDMHSVGKAAALNNCISRIQKAISRLILEIRLKTLDDPELSAFQCNISGEVPTGKIVTTKCGHIFDEVLIKKHLKTKKGSQEEKTCPTCREPVTPTALARCYRIENYIAEWLRKEPIPTYSQFKSKDEDLETTDYFLETAKIYMEEGKHDIALKSCRIALQYTKSSEVYALLPQIYGSLGMEDEKRLAYLYLILYQIKEDNIAGAIETLSHPELVRCLWVPPIKTSLSLLQAPSLGELDLGKIQSMIAAKEITAEDKTFLWGQVFANVLHQPGLSDKVLDSLKDREEKKKLLLLAAEWAKEANQTEIEGHFLRKANNLPFFYALSKEDWATANIGNLPPIPQTLETFLNGNCSLFPGKTRRETFIVFPLLTRVTLNGASTRRTLENVNLLDKAAGGTGLNRIYEKVDQKMPAGPTFEWAVMTKDVIPNSRNKIYGDLSKRLTDAGYEVPGSLDAATALLWDKRGSKMGCFDSTYTFCKDTANGQRLLVGGFTERGLNITHRQSKKDTDIGIAAFKRFPCARAS